MPKIITKGKKHLLPAGIKKTCENCDTTFITETKDQKAEYTRQDTIYGGWYITCPICFRGVYIKENDERSNGS